MREGFHAHGGWYFRRDDNGHVTIEVAESDQVDAPLHVAASFDPDTWASIVAAVSGRGEDGETWNAARSLHMAGPAQRVVNVIGPGSPVYPSATVNTTAGPTATVIYPPAGER